MKSIFTLLTVVIALSGYSIEVPLKYVAQSSTQTGPKIATVHVADFDMLAPGSRPAPLHLDFGTSQGVGLCVNADDPRVAITVQGRTAGYNPQWNGSGLYADLAKQDVYVLVEYLDDASSGSCLELNYRSTHSDTPEGYKRITGPIGRKSGQWKRHEFHVTDAKWQGRSPGSGSQKSDFWFGFGSDAGHPLPVGPAFLHPSLSPPSGNYKLPRLVGPIPFYAQVGLGDTSRLMAVDRTAAQEPFYNRVWFDMNGNGDLTDDPSVVASETESVSDGAIATFHVDTTIRIGKRILPYKFRLVLNSSSKTLHDRNFQNRLLCIGYAEAHYSASIILEGIPYTIFLGDANCNGRFSDRAQLPDRMGEVASVSGDVIRVAASQRTAPIDGVLGNQLVLENKLYDIAVDETRGVLSVTPTPGRLYPLKLSSPAEKLQLYSTDRQRFILVVDSGTELSLPGGAYALYSYSMARTDPSGDVWELSARADPKSPTTATVLSEASEENTSGSLAFGEPYLARITVAEGPAQAVRNALASSQKASGSNVSLTLDFDLRGIGRERVFGIVHRSGDKTNIRRSVNNSARPAEPQYRIVGEDGELVASGQFEYG